MSGVQFSWEMEPRLWPKASSQFVFLARAFDEVGKALFPDDWTGKEARSINMPATEKVRELEQQAKNLERHLVSQRVPLPLTLRWRPSFVEHAVKCTKEPYSAHVIAYHLYRGEQRLAQLRIDAAAEAEQFAASGARRIHVADWIASRARDDELVTYGLWTGGGRDPVPLSSSIWNVQDDWTIFKSCVVECFGKHPLLQTTKFPYFVLLTRESLDEQLSNHTRKAVGEVVSLANAQSKARQWLLDQFADEGTKTISKPDFRALALANIPGLSGEAFKRAWAEAGKEYPERLAKGRKSSGK